MIPVLAQAAPHVNEFAAAWGMIVDGTPSTKLILATLAVFSFASWVVLFWKWKQFRRMHEEADRCLDELEGAQRVEDAYRTICELPDSPFTRLFRRGVNFFSELRPGALRETGPVRGLTPAQLEVLRMVLEKEEGEEREELASGIQWLAIIATVSPLLGLLGTVLGVMNSFVGVAAAGSSNINAVAPGIAEALIATAAGLIVAIPALMGYNYFAGRLNRFASEMESFSSEFIGTLAREGKV
jgi:biopolymer transport protein TolQ